MTYIVCNHEWSFLEGDKKHNHTLKAGRHLFPFQLHIGGSLPSSISTGVFGGASVAYKLRAVAVRPGFAHNLLAQLPVTITRSFAPEALEYQQTLEIENTWPEKLMYSIMIPHKAWAAGDTLTAVVKFQPIAKGARVLSVSTMVNETVKLYARAGWQENTRPVVSAKHEIINGRAVCVDHQQHRTRGTPAHQPSYGPRPTQTGSMPATPAAVTPYGSGGNSPLGTPSSPLNHSGYFPPMTGLTSEPNNHSPDSGPSSHSQTPASEAGPSSRAAPMPVPSSSYNIPLDFEPSDSDVVTAIDVVVPSTATPTHALEPIIVSHRIRWSILISNLDGHTSELRCSLPLHVLDWRLIDEARAATAQTRRLLLGGPEIADEQADDMELPSYSSHVRDRVANMYLPEAATLRVSNPWVTNGVNPIQPAETTLSSGSHTPHSPLDAQQILSQLPTDADAGSANLEYVNSELLLSLSQDEPPRLQNPSVDTPPTTTPPSQTVSRPGSRSHSRRPSRHGSRAPSPEPHAGGSRPGNPNDTYVHAQNPASRASHGLFNISMKPFTTISSPFSLNSRSNSHTNLASLTSLTGHGHHSPSNSQSASGAASPQLRPQPPPLRQQNTSPATLHRAFTEVPDYGIASRGFLGGVPPLASMQGLPSYEEAERSSSETDLAARFARAQAQHMSLPSLSLPNTPAGERPRRMFTTGAQ